MSKGAGMTDYRVGVDIGGTFTDIVFMDPDGGILTKKVSSSVDNYSRAIVEGLAELFDEAGLKASQVLEVMHGTTVGSNTILEQKGAKAGLITTKGFRDVLEIRTLRMPRLYDLHWEKPPPLIPRYLRAEVDERVDASGGIMRPLDRGEVERVVDKLLAEDVDVIAVCLINCFAHPEHERLIGEVIAERAPGLDYCLSVDVLPEIKEYERTSTTAINAYVMPVIRLYLESLRQELDNAEITAPLMMMQSNGGLMTDRQAARQPCRIIESGPAGGVVGAQALCSRLDLSNVITFDMGGTTAKASLIERGEYTRSQEYSVGGGIMIGSRLLTGAGYQLKTPAIDLAEVGAGGGSLIWIDAGGSIQVGPESAGADPGPVVYDTGGTEPTVTDANVMLGYINPGQLVGGAVKLNKAKAEAVFAAKIAEPLGVSPERAAYGSHLIAASNMIRAIKAVSSERGRDPRSYALFAIGGNGPVFAAGMAEALGMSRIVVPPSPGLFSSFGLLYADVELHFTRTLNRVLREVPAADLTAAWDAIAAEARAELRAEGFPDDRIVTRRAASMHYKGQIFELTVSAPDGDFDTAKLAELEEAFGQEHETTYGHRAGPEEPVELVNMQVVAQGVAEHSRIPERITSTRAEPDAGGTRQAYFGDAGWLETPILRRSDLAGGVEGPAIVEEYDATCIIPPGWRAKLDDYGSMLLDRVG